MSKTYEVKWDERQIWSNTAFITAESEEELEQKFTNEEYDYTVDSQYSFTEGIFGGVVNITEVVEEKEDVSSN